MGNEVSKNGLVKKCKEIMSGVLFPEIRLTINLAKGDVTASTSKTCNVQDAANICKVLLYNNYVKSINVSWKRDKDRYSFTLYRNKPANKIALYKNEQIAGNYKEELERCECYPFFEFFGYNRDRLREDRSRVDWVFCSNRAFDVARKDDNMVIIYACVKDGLFTTKITPYCYTLKNTITIKKSVLAVNDYLHKSKNLDYELFLSFNNDRYRAYLGLLDGNVYVSVIHAMYNEGTTIQIIDYDADKMSSLLNEYKIPNKIVTLEHERVIMIG